MPVNPDPGQINSETCVRKLRTFQVPVSACSVSSRLTFEGFKVRLGDDRGEVYSKYLLEVAEEPKRGPGKVRVNY